MEPNISIRAIWEDDDLVEIEASACNESFSGRTQVYTTYDELQTFCASLAGFPVSPSSRLTSTAGKAGSYSLFQLKVYCIDSACHTAVRATIESNVPTKWRSQQKHSVGLEMHFEPSALDQFQRQLAALISAHSGEAILSGVGEYTRNIGPKDLTLRCS